MAEPASAVLTIVTVTYEVVKRTCKYINEIGVINETIKDLLVQLRSLHELIKLVHDTCKGAEPSAANPSSIFVGKNLNMCKKRLEELKPRIFELAARDSESWRQKVSLKMKSDAAKKEIESAISDINASMEQIRMGITCWSLDVATANRRISEILASQQATNIRNELRDPFNYEGNALRRTMSTQDTLYAPDPMDELRRLSSTTTASTSRQSISASSISSQALQTQSDDNRSIMSDSGVSPTKPNSDWISFHFAISKCEGREANIEQIRRVLQNHAASTTLAQSADDSKRTPLHLAAQRGDIELARVLVNFGGDINAKDSEDASVLDHATEKNKRNFVEFLIDQGVDESNILERNKRKFKEAKAVIEFSKSSAKKPAKESRRLRRAGSLT